MLKNVKVTLRKLLLGLRAQQNNASLFIQVEKEANPDSIICAYSSVDRETVLAYLPHLSTYIRNCIRDSDFENIFLYEDYSITTLTKSIPIKVGKIQVNSTNPTWSPGTYDSGIK